jgi:hypothetical protein
MWFIVCGQIATIGMVIWPTYLLVRFICACGQNIMMTMAIWPMSVSHPTPRSGCRKSSLLPQHYPSEA